ncbi:MAG TPA: magnesium transporter CorA family protein [Candidatus Limnocylindrales bacterium]|jgi:magnesium transporter|nr:magnesium transporter CorA family protein [Candidatus Limnocylindrales bacterium]
MTTTSDRPSRSEGADAASGRAGRSAEPAARFEFATRDESSRRRPRLRAWAWSSTGHLEEPRNEHELREAYARPKTLVWADIEEADKGILEALGKCFELHPLIIEDITERNQRPKIEVTGDVAHLVLFALDYEDRVVEMEIDVVLGERFLLTAHPAGWDPLEGQHLRDGVEAILREGPDHVLWALADYAVDGYFPVFDQLSDEIEVLQSDVLERPSQAVVERLFQIRRDLVAIRHAVTPEREVFNQLTNRELPLIQPDHVVYFRDIYDHLIRLTDELDSFRELVSTTLEAYLSTVNNNLSEIMKRLTAATVILAGIGAAAGIFGMSEAGLALRLAEAPGFWVVTAIVIAIGAVALVYFRRIGWL